MKPTIFWHEPDYVFEKPMVHVTHNGTTKIMTPAEAEAIKLLIGDDDHVTIIWAEPKQTNETKTENGENTN